MDTSPGLDFSSARTSYYLSYLTRTLQEQKLFSFLAVFLVVLCCLKANQYLFYHFDTSPAVVLLPTGIAVAAVYLAGYRMWLPIACAWFLGTITSPANPSILLTVVVALAQTIQAVAAGYALTRVGFRGTMARTRGALMLNAIVLIAPVIAPTIITTFQWLLGTLSDSIWITWSRSWAGGVMSILIFTPLITTWVREQREHSRKELVEGVAALVCLVGAIFLTFWTKLPQLNAFLVLYLLLGILFWIGLRLSPRIVTLAIFLIAFLGIAGSIIAHPGAVPLNRQLLADELFIVFISPIFFILTALVEERRESEVVNRVRTKELEEANRRLSLEDQAKNEFLATLAHELRNPLAPVVSSLELIRIEVEKLDRPDLIKLINIATMHNSTLVHLLDDLLDVSRISRKKFKLEKESVEVHDIVAQAEQTVQALYTARGHALVISLPKEKFWITADALRLEQVLVNLLNNAANYTEPGGRIELKVARDAEKGVRFTISDNGIGIESHLLNKIFEPFVQSNDRSQGLGIGLSLTKRLVELHGGKVKAESPGLGRGSTFTVTLPTSQNVQPSLVSSVKRDNQNNASPAKTSTKRQYNILLVDDNEAAADALGRLLTLKGHEVTLAFDGVSAIEKVRGFHPQVVFLDIGLPDMDGYTVAKSLRQEHGNEILLIALSGYGQKEDKAKARSAGFDDHLTKPVSIVDIEAVLAAFTEKSARG